MIDLSIINVLRDMADQQEFAAPQDELTELINRFKEDKELSMDEMEMVAAAGNTHMMDYQEFLSRMKEFE